MASNLKISAAARSAACNAVVDLIDGGSGAGRVEIRTGSPPATPATADSGTLLATCPMSDPAFGSASAGVAVANSISDDSSADDSGDAGHFRVKDSDDAVILQGTAGEAADTSDMEFDDKSIVAGGVVGITSFSVTMPEQ